jgi:spore protease
MHPFRSDLAMETTEFLKNTPQGDYPPGVLVTEEQKEKIFVTRVKVTNQEGVLAIGKPMGTYITLEMPSLSEEESFDMTAICQMLSSEIKDLMNLKQHHTILVVGLGNWNITPDSLGPKVVSETLVTRHILEFENSSPSLDAQDLRSVCAISPGVLGITGIETFEIVRGVVDRVKPDCIIAIDALASRKVHRVSNSIQLSDTGISPGSGVGNKRKGLTQESLGRPVIAIGVPTVIDAGTLAKDAILLMLEDLRTNAASLPDEFKHLRLLNENHAVDMESTLQKLMDPYFQRLIVTPKEIDEMIQRVSTIIARSLNIALGTDSLH